MRLKSIINLPEVTRHVGTESDPYIIYNANGLTTVFPFDFYIINASDIQVSINGTPVATGFTVSGAGNVSGEILRL